MKSKFQRWYGEIICKQLEDQVEEEVDMRLSVMLGNWIIDMYHYFQCCFHHGHDGRPWTRLFWVVFYVYVFNFSWCCCLFVVVVVFVLYFVDFLVVFLVIIYYYELDFIN